MADFTRLAIPELYLGQSTDTKSTNAPVGSMCLERDTNDWYITADGSTWTLYKGDPQWLHS